MDQVHGLVVDGLGLELLDCATKLSVNFVDTPGPFEIKQSQLLDNPVSGIRRHFLDLITFIHLVPQLAIDLGQMSENRANTARNFRDRVSFFPINLVRGESQPLWRNPTKPMRLSDTLKRVRVVSIAICAARTRSS